MPDRTDAWCNFWHYHADWQGWGNLGWRHRKEHLRAHGIAFGRILAHASEFPVSFQTWMLINGTDAGQDAVFLHTPNPQSCFPWKADEFVWGQPIFEKALQSILGVDGLRAGHNPATGTYVVYRPGIGASLE